MNLKYSTTIFRFIVKSHISDKCNLTDCSYALPIATFTFFSHANKGDFKFDHVNRRIAPESCARQKIRSHLRKHRNIAKMREDWRNLMSMIR